MPQKFLHLNCFFTCGITASNLLTFWSMALAVGGCTRAPKISASFVRTRRSLIAFASTQFFDLIIALYGPDNDATDDTPYQKLACSRGVVGRVIVGAIQRDDQDNDATDDTPYQKLACSRIC